MPTVKEILAKKGNQVHTISHDKTVFEAVALMNEKNIGALIVTHQEEGQDKVCGIISERDYLRHIVLKGRTSRKTPIQEIMTKKVIYSEPDCTVEKVLNIMTGKRIRHLPIMEKNQLVGLISIGDCVRTVIKLQGVEIKYLKQYIADTYPGPAHDDT